MIELADPYEIAAQKALWLAEHPERESSTCEKWNQKWKYTDERKSALQLIAENYKKSEEKRKAKRARNGAVRAAGKKAEEAENERWDRIFKEKFEDKSYYAR